MSQESRDDANEVIHDLAEASKTLNNATVYAKRYIKDPILHKRLDETKAKIDETKTYLKDKLGTTAG